MMPEIIPNPHVALNNARKLPNCRASAAADAKSTNADGAAAIEHYIDQRDKLWRQLALNQAELSAITLNLLKDRNDFIEALFRFKLIKKLFSPARIILEKQRAKICDTFIDQLKAEQQAIIRNGANLLNS